jgi:hypothetical protein
MYDQSNNDLPTEQNLAESKSLNLRKHFSQQNLKYDVQSERQVPFGQHQIERKERGSSKRTNG